MMLSKEEKQDLIGKINDQAEQMHNATLRKLGHKVNTPYDRSEVIVFRSIIENIIKEIPEVPESIAIKD